MNQRCRTWKYPLGSELCFIQCFQQMKPENLSLNGTVLWDWVGPCTVLMDSGQYNAKPPVFCKHAARTIIGIKKWRRHYKIWESTWHMCLLRPIHEHYEWPDLISWDSSFKIHYTNIYEKRHIWQIFQLRAILTWRPMEKSTGPFVPSPSSFRVNNCVHCSTF